MASWVQVGCRDWSCPAFPFATKSTQGLEAADCTPNVLCNSDVKLVLAVIDGRQCQLLQEVLRPDRHLMQM